MTWPYFKQHADVKVPIRYSMDGAGSQCVAGTLCFWSDRQVIRQFNQLALGASVKKPFWFATISLPPKNKFEVSDRPNQLKKQFELMGVDPDQIPWISFLHPDRKGEHYHTTFLPRTFDGRDIQLRAMQRHCIKIDQYFKKYFEMPQTSVAQTSKFIELGVKIPRRRLRRKEYSDLASALEAVLQNAQPRNIDEMNAAFFEQGGGHGVRLEPNQHGVESFQFTREGAPLTFAGKLSSSLEPRFFKKRFEHAALLREIRASIEVAKLFRDVSMPQLNSLLKKSKEIENDARLGLQRIPTASKVADPNIAQYRRNDGWRSEDVRNFGNDQAVGARHSSEIENRADIVSGNLGANYGKSGGDLGRDAQHKQNAGGRLSGFAGDNGHVNPKPTGAVWADRTNPQLDDETVADSGRVAVDLITLIARAALDLGVKWKAKGSKAGRNVAVHLDCGSEIQVLSDRLILKAVGSKVAKRPLAFARKFAELAGWLFMPVLVPFTAAQPLRNGTWLAVTAQRLRISRLQFLSKVGFITASSNPRVQEATIAEIATSWQVPRYAFTFTSNSQGTGAKSQFVALPNLIAPEVREDVGKRLEKICMAHPGIQAFQSQTGLVDSAEVARIFLQGETDEPEGRGREAEPLSADVDDNSFVL